MTNSVVDIKKTPAPRESVPDFWRSFRGEMDRLFDRFDSGFRLPSMRRMFDLEPTVPSETAFAFNVPAVEIGRAHV